MAEMMWIIEFMLGGLCIILWFMLLDVKKKAEAVAEALLLYKAHVAETYVSGTHLDKTMESVNRSLDALLTTVSRIEERLYKKEQQ